ncbi:hypothetical protein [Acinetobacter sp. NigerLNRRAM0016]
MDMNKEREVFEQHFKETRTYIHECQIRNGLVLDTFITDYNSYINLTADDAWQLWLKAKAHAVPEGYVLIPKEPTPKMIDSTWAYDDEISLMSDNSRNEFIYKKMIAAQEQQ